MTSSTDNNAGRQSAAAAGELTRLRMRVDGMTCPSCERHVEQALLNAGAAEAGADFRRGEAVVSVQGPPDEAALQAAVEATGYRPGAVERISPEPESDAAQRQYRLSVEGMTCTDCERHVSEALLDAGALNPVANFRRGEAHFSAPAAAELRLFEEAVASAGYRPGQAEVRTPQQAKTHRNGRAGGDRYDLAIVGSGGGAFAAAITATERGARVVMIERGTLGGTCVNVGCVPSKTQLRAGELFWHAGNQPFNGIRTRAETVDLPALVRQKDELVASLRKEKYADLIHEYGCELVRGEAVFEDPQTLRVGDRAIFADGVVLATGARPAVPAIEGLDAVDYLTSTSLLDLKRLPEHVIVIGAGYVGLELGQLFRHLGSRVTLMQRSERMLNGEDPEIGDVVHEVLTAEGIEVLLDVTYLDVKQDAAGKHVRVLVGGHERTIQA